MDYTTIRDFTLGLRFTNKKTIGKWEWDLGLNKITEKGIQEKSELGKGIAAHQPRPHLKMLD